MDFGILEGSRGEARRDTGVGKVRCEDKSGPSDIGVPNFGRGIVSDSRSCCARPSDIVNFAFLIALKAMGGMIRCIIYSFWKGRGCCVEIGAGILVVFADLGRFPLTRSSLSAERFGGTVGLVIDYNHYVAD